METSFVITHAAMNTPLGLDLHTSCASARAGIVRNENADYYPLGSPTKGEIETAIVHPLPVITKGFEGLPRLQVILTKTVSDMANEIGDQLHKMTTAVYVSLPHPARIYRGCALAADEPNEALRELEKTIASEPVDDEKYKTMIEQVFSAHWPTPIVIRQISCSGSAGVAECVKDACTDLTANHDNMLGIIVGIDSLLSPDDLNWLQSTGRLKCDENPVGVQAGESGAAIAICTPETAKSNAFLPMASIEHVTCGEEKNSLLSGEPADGRGLAGVMVELVGHGAGSNNGVWLISDHNGEEHRAHQMGMAQLHLKKQKPEVEICDVWYPAISFGHCEASFGLVGTGMALAAFKRGYAPRQSAHVLASSDAGALGGLLVNNWN